MALSKTVSECKTLGRENQKDRVFRVAFCTFLVMGIVSFLCLSVFGQFVAANLLHNEKAVFAVVALSPSVLCACCCSAFRGYAQGHMNMVPTGVSQVIEALSKMVLGLILATVIHYSAIEPPELRERLTAAGALVGVSIGSVLSVVYLIWNHIRTRQRRKVRPTDRPSSNGEIFAHLMKLAIPITVGASIIAATNILDSAILMDRLQEGLDMTEDAARTLKGVYNKTMTLYNLPASFMVPLTSSVIPAVSAARAVRNYRQGAQISETTLRTTALLAFPAGVGLFVLGEPIIRLLYPSTDVELAGWMLSVLGIASIAVCFMLVSNSIMQAHKLVTLPMATTLIGCILKLIVGYFLIGNPDINIRGGAISTLACFGIITLLDLVIIKLALPRSLSYVRVFAKPAAAAAAMGATAWAVNGLTGQLLMWIDSLLKREVPLFLAVGEDGALLLDQAGKAMLSWKGNALAVTAAIVYFALILLTKAISKEDLALMPKGDKIARLLRIQ